MKKVSIYVTPFFQKNRLFDLNDTLSNHDNALYHWSVLKDHLKRHGYDLATQDIHSPSESEFIIYSDMPRSLTDVLNNPGKNYLILFEPPVVYPGNWNKKKHTHFNCIFTWNDNWVDTTKYIKMYWPNKIPTSFTFNSGIEKKLCTLIAGYKQSTHKNEIYSERIRSIRWFEQNHPEDVDLYGIGWDQFYFFGSVTRKLNRFSRLRNLLPEPGFSSYRGPITSKKDILSKYKFAICYENEKDLPGWITEKIFDCFFAGCVPVYWGAPNISKQVTAGTFIDRRNFTSHEELYTYLSTMPDPEYNRYLDSIFSYVTGDDISLFSAENFAQTIIKNIIQTPVDSI